MLFQKKNRRSKQKLNMNWKTLKKMPGRKLILTIEHPASCQQAARLLAETTKVRRKLQRIE
jgi:hypothetical protein